MAGSNLSCMSGSVPSSILRSESMPPPRSSLNAAWTENMACRNSGRASALRRGALADVGTSSSYSAAREASPWLPRSPLEPASTMRAAAGPAAMVVM
eukprot:2462432-Pleurochrysis_carterae.AAC.2